MVEPRSSTTKPFSERESRACLRETFGFEMTMSFSSERPMLHGPCPSKGCVSSSKTVPTRLLCGDRSRPLILPWRGTEDAGLTRGVFRGAFFARPLTAGELGGHSELTEAQGVLGDEADLGRGHEVIALILGVSCGVLDQLVHKRALVGLDGLRVLLGEVNGEVVRGVGPGNAHHAVLVHLLG